MTTTNTVPGILRIGGNVWDGDFDFLPFAAELGIGVLPLRPTSADFHLAVTDVESDLDDVTAHWRLEAIRERIARPGCKLDSETKRAINGRVAARLFKRVRETS